MSRSASRSDQPELYRCIEPFSVFRNGVPLVFNGNTEVLGDDPILKTHRSHFEPAANRLRAVEQATAAPGELRATALGYLPRQQITNNEESSNG